jgi:hypothetical protein
VRQAAGRKNLQFSVHVVWHASDGRLSILEQEIGSARIAIVGEADAAGIGDNFSLNASDVRMMDVCINGYRVVKRRED